MGVVSSFRPVSEVRGVRHLESLRKRFRIYTVPLTRVFCAAQQIIETTDNLVPVTPRTGLATNCKISDVWRQKAYRLRTPRVGLSSTVRTVFVFTNPCTRKKTFPHFVKHYRGKMTARPAPEYLPGGYLGHICERLKSTECDGRYNQCR